MINADWFGTGKEPTMVTDSNKSQLLYDLDQIDQVQGIILGTTSMTVLQICRQLLNGLFDKQGIHRMFKNLSREYESLRNLKSYIRDVRYALDDSGTGSEGLEHLSEIQSQIQDQHMPYTLKEETMGFRTTLNEEIDFDFIEQGKGGFEMLAQFSSHGCSFRGPLSVIHNIDVEIRRPIPSLSPEKHFNNSTVSTNSNHSIFKSCIITERNKEFIRAEDNTQVPEVDYRKEYEKKMHANLFKSVLYGYNRSKRK